jgi:hypothetical protein
MNARLVRDTTTLGSGVRLGSQLGRYVYLSSVVHRQGENVVNVD